MTAQDPVMERIAAAQQRAAADDAAGARADLAAIWAELGDDGDALHVVTLAHHMADLQDDPREELAWDLLALRAADRLSDERLQAHHASLLVRGFLPSLHLNLAADHTRLGDPAAAREHLAAAEVALPDLPDDSYRAMISDAITRLRGELGPA